MEPKSIYKDIESRTGGNIYIGVVGPVRTGKSTFIKRFMDTLVVPHIADENLRERTIDELPQSAAGRTIMTTEPKFVPENAVPITLEDNARLSVRMIDCVGYIVESAMGYIEEDGERMVRTPWSESEMSFRDAAELGTKKVVTDHSTVGVLVTTDGSIGDIDREDYVAAEERVAAELTASGKPFIILLNTTAPESASASALANSLSRSYGAPAVAVDCAMMDENTVKGILAALLFEFPIREIQTDNGTEFTKALISNDPNDKSLFELKLKEYQISYHRIRIATPRHNGKVERQHRIDQQRFYDRLRMFSLEDGRKQLSVYQNRSNDYIKHCLGLRSPNQVLADYQAVM